MSFLETLVRLDIVKQVFAREARFLYLVCVLWFTVCKSPEPPALERRCHPMSPLCVSTEITLAPHHWGKLRWVPVFGQYLEPTARGALQHPQMSIGDYTQRLWVGFSETAYSLCFEKAQHSLTEFNIMPDTSTAEAEDGEEPSISLLQVPGRITVGRSCAVSITCSRGSTSSLAGLFCHCSSLELSAAPNEPARERVCVCIKILPKVGNNSTTKFIKFRSPRHSAGAFPKPGN